jgi:hypothetical protein
MPIHTIIVTKDSKTAVVRLLIEGGEIRLIERPSYTVAEVSGKG